MSGRCGHGPRRIDRPALRQLVTGKGPSDQRWQTRGLDLRKKLFFPRRHLPAKPVQRPPRGLCLGEHALSAPFLFLHMMLDLFGEDFDLSIIEFGIRRARQQLGDQHLCPVMFDIGFVNQIVLDLSRAGRIQNLFHDQGVNAKLGTYLLHQGLLLHGSPCALEFLEKAFDLAVIGLQKGDGIQFRFVEHVTNSNIRKYQLSEESTALRGLFLKLKRRKLTRPWPGLGGRYAALLKRTGPLGLLRAGEEKGGRSAALDASKRDSRFSVSPPAIVSAAPWSSRSWRSRRCHPHAAAAGSRPTGPDGCRYPAIHRHRRSRRLKRLCCSAERR